MLLIIKKPQMNECQSFSMHPYTVKSLDVDELLVKFSTINKNSPISGGVLYVHQSKGKLWSKAKKETELICPTSTYYTYSLK